MSHGYVELAEAYEHLTARLRATRAPAQRKAAVTELRRQAQVHVDALDEERLERLAVWNLDYFYRLFNRLELVDDASIEIVRALGGCVVDTLARAGRPIAYLADNRMPHDRVVASRPFFAAMDVIVASPEWLALQLAAADGEAVEDIHGDHLPRYLTEATVLATQLFDDAIAGKSSVLWISGECDLDVYRELARHLDGTGYIGVFRNAEPRDGTTVQVFRTANGQVELDPDA